MRWDLVQLGDCCEIVMGQAPKGNTYNEHGKGLPLLAGASDLGEIYPAPARHTTGASKIAEYGDIILCIRATIGDKNWADKQYCLGRGVAGLRPLKSLVPKYLWYCIENQRALLASKGKGSTFKQVSKADITELEIPLPPLSEQKRIAAILDKADAIRRKRKAALDMADEFLRATFLDMFGDPVTNPKGWDVKPFGKLIKTIRNGLSPSSKGTYPGTVFTLSAVTGPDFLPSAKKAALFDKDPSAYEAKPSDFLICRGNGNLKLVGKAKFPKGSFMATAFPDTIIAANVDTQAVLPEVLEAQWATFFIRDQIERGARTTNGTYKINQSVIKSIKVVIPDMEAQLAFRDQVNGLGLYLTKLSDDQSNNLFESLSQRAFRGEL